MKQMRLLPQTTPPPLCRHHVPHSSPSAAKDPKACSVSFRRYSKSARVSTDSSSDLYNRATEP